MIIGENTFYARRAGSDSPAPYTGLRKATGVKVSEPKQRRGSPPAYFFFAADLVALPSPSDLVTLLMTPTATVWRMSRTAKRPSGG